MAVLGLIYMFLTSVILTLLTIAILPVLLIALRIYSGLSKKYTQEGLTASAEASTIAEEVFGSIRTVRLMIYSLTPLFQNMTFMTLFLVVDRYPLK